MTEVRQVPPAELARLAPWTRRASRATTPRALAGAVSFARESAALEVLYGDGVADLSAGFVLGPIVEPAGVAVVCRTEHPGDGAAEAAVHTLVAESPAAPSLLLDAAVGWAVDRGCVCLRLRSDAAPAGKGWLGASVRVTKRVDPEAAVAALRTAPVRVRSATRDDLPVLIRGVRRSVSEGLMPFERARLGEARVERWSRDFLAGLPGSTGAALVAEHEGRPVGYALADLERADDMTGDLEAWLHDVLIVDPAAPGGTGRALTATVEMLAAKHGRTALSGTVDRPGTARSQALLGRLRAAGWHCRETTSIADLTSSRRPRGRPRPSSRAGSGGRAPPRSS